MRSYLLTAFLTLSLVAPFASAWALKPTGLESTDRGREEIAQALQSAAAGLEADRKALVFAPDRYAAERGQRWAGVRHSFSAGENDVLATGEVGAAVSWIQGEKPSLLVYQGSNNGSSQDLTEAAELAKLLYKQNARAHFVWVGHISASNEEARRALPSGLDVVFVPESGGGKLRDVIEKMAKSAGLEYSVTVEGVRIPRSGVEMTWYNQGNLAPTALLPILDTERSRLLLPLAQADLALTTLSIQEGVLPEDLVQGLKEKGVAVRTFPLDDLPEPVADVENIYVLNVPPGSERAKPALSDADILVINLRSPTPQGRPRNLLELGALINRVRSADSGVVSVLEIYRSGLEAIAIST